MTLAQLRTELAAHRRAIRMLVAVLEHMRYGVGGDMVLSERHADSFRRALKRAKSIISRVH